MRLYNHNSDTSYELVYSTKDPKSGSRDGNAGNQQNKPAKGGSRSGSAGTNIGNPSRGRGYFKEDKPDQYTPSKVIKKKQQERKEQDDHL